VIPGCQSGHSAGIHGAEASFRQEIDTFGHSSYSPRTTPPEWTDKNSPTLESHGHAQRLWALLRDARRTSVKQGLAEVYGRALADGTGRYPGAPDDDLSSQEESTSNRSKERDYWICRRNSSSGRSQAMDVTWINPKEYPFRPQQLNLAMGTMSYVDEGEGEALVMVHGNPSWSFEFRALIKHFAKTHRCIAPDHIGFGLSDKPADWDYLPQQHAENFESLLESLDLERITLVVGDWGGPIGLSYAIRHPETIRQIVITNTWLWSTNDDWYYRVFSGLVGGPIGRWLIRRHNFFARTILKATFGNKSKLTPEIHRHYVQPLSRPEERKGCWVFPKQITAASDWLADLWARRGRLKSKIRLIGWGMKDIAFREKELNQWQKQFPAARIVRYPDAGHLIAEEKSAELIEELTGVLADNT
jgi:haloalkane dehalogenase